MKKNYRKLYEAKEFKDIKEILYNSVKIYKDKIAFVIKHKENKEIKYENITYPKLLEDVNSLGTSFYELGLKGKRIAIIGKNRYEWAISHFGALLGEIVSVPLDKDLQYDELENSLIRSKADCIIFDEKLKNTIDEIKKNNNTQLTEYISMDKLDGYKNIEQLIKDGEKLIKSGKKDYINAKIDENKMNILLFTSGTTSKSKAVMLSQKNIASNIYAMQCVEDINCNDTNIAFLPFHHTFGCTGILMFLSLGATNVFCDGLRHIQKNLIEYEVSTFVCVPLLIESIYKKIWQEIEKSNQTKKVKFGIALSKILLKIGIDIRPKLFKPIKSKLGGKIRMVISGASGIDPKVADGFRDFGIYVVQGYGLTETSPVLAAENVKYYKTGSTGLPMPGVELQIDNPNEQGIGEIKAKGPNVMLGYYENEEETNKVLKDGWFYTGDLGYMDKDGFLYITGRKKNVIVLKNGKNVYPEELEVLIGNLPYVKENMVFGKEKDDDLVVSAKIVYNQDYMKDNYPDKTQEDIEKIIWEDIKEINKTMPNYKHIKNIIVTDQEMIKTTTAKIKRYEEIKKL